MLNLEQTKSLFDKEAILFFNCNVISKKGQKNYLELTRLKPPFNLGKVDRITIPSVEKNLNYHTFILAVSR